LGLETVTVPAGLRSNEGAGHGQLRFADFPSRNNCPNDFCIRYIQLVGSWVGWVKADSSATIEGGDAIVG
jgi:hypothetical protein